MTSSDSAVKLICNNFTTSHLILRKKRGIVKLSISHRAQPGSAVKEDISILV